MTARSGGQPPSRGVPCLNKVLDPFPPAFGSGRRYFHDPTGPSKAKEEDGDWTRVISTTRGPLLKLQNLPGLQLLAGRSQSSSYPSSFLNFLAPCPRGGPHNARVFRLQLYPTSEFPHRRTILPIKSAEALRAGGSLNVTTGRVNAGGEQRARGGRRARRPRRLSSISETCRDRSSRGVGRKARQYVLGFRFFHRPLP